LNDEDCSYENQADGCVYEDEMFEKRVTKIIKDHDEKYPLFLFWATHAVHGPYQPPAAYKKQVMKWSSSSGNVAYFMDRTKYYGALAFIDDAIGRVVDLVKERGLYDDMLIVLSSDNGGVAGASNEPLRGAKFTNWEGGIRAVSCVSGGKIPEQVRGTMQHGLIAGQDWYATFAHLAGVDPTDHKAATAKLPPVDSMNVWPLLSGQTEDSPRAKVVIGTTAGGYKNTARRSGEPRVSGVVQKVFGTLYKLVLGDTPELELECGTVFGPGHEDLEDPDTNCPHDSQVCGDTPETGCLFDLDADPEESKSVAMEKDRVFSTLIKNLLEANHSVYKPNRGSWRKEDCDSMTNLFGGYLGPFNMKPGAIWGPMKPGHTGSVFDDDEHWQHLQ
jgi:arylsulfatase I/J